MRHALATLFAVATLAACAASATTAPDLSRALPSGVSARAESRVVPGVVENVVLVDVTVRNDGAAPATLELRGCPVLLRLYRAGASPAAYDESGNPCVRSLLTLTLAAGQSEKLGRAVNVSTVAPKGTTTATYRVEAVLGVTSTSGPGIVLPAGEVTIP